VAPVKAAPRARGRGKPEPPPAPWGSFPLVELCVLLALVLGIWGFAKGGQQGGVMMGAAAALGSLAGLEVAIREHFAGFKSHSTVLASCAAVATLAITVIAGAPRIVTVAAGLFVGVSSFYFARRAYLRREGIG
jgi:hypothetical protein